MMWSDGWRSHSLTLSIDGNGLEQWPAAVSSHPSHLLLTILIFSSSGSNAVYREKVHSLLAGSYVDAQCPSCEVARKWSWYRSECVQTISVAPDPDTNPMSNPRYEYTLSGFFLISDYSLISGSWYQVPDIRLTWGCAEVFLLWMSSVRKQDYIAIP